MPVLFALFVVIGCWMVVIPACYGWGATTLLIGRIGWIQANREPQQFWIGFVALIGLLQIWHIFLPVDWVATTVFLGTGFSIWLAGGHLRRWRSILARPAYLVILVILGLWLANRGLDYARNGDSGLYHFATIRWINEHSIVPGLANLHDRFGFNQSYFLFVALLNAFPFFNEGYHLANSLLVVVLTAQVLGSTLKVIQSPRESSISDLLKCLLLPIVSFQGLTWNISSPSPDLAVLICGMALFVGLVSFLDRFFASANNPSIIPVLITVSVGSCTLKLSFVAFGLTTMAIVLWVLRTNRAHSSFRFRDGVVWLAGAVVMFGGIYCLRGIILSGYPAYPITFFPWPADWRVPSEDAQNTANWIYSWARTPGVHWRDVLGNWTWVGPWWNRALAISHVRLVLTLITTVTALLVFSLARPSCRSRIEWRWLPFLPLISGISYWFFTAPDPRFGEWMFWLMAAWLSACLIFINPTILGTPIARAVACAMILIIGIVLVDFPKLWLGPGWASLPRPLTANFKTDSGLVVIVPASDEDVLLWDTPLPSAPLKNRRLELRGRDLGRGFRVRPEDPEKEASK